MFAIHGLVKQMPALILVKLILLQVCCRRGLCLKIPARGLWQISAMKENDQARAGSAEETAAATAL